ncbi:hypothetical protein V7128_02000 [Neobacillus vireti]|uniref:hypothetical protein n=1 Tax=Neobacillus vireti TaxID=220686 RepID=UPI002FFF6C96
MDSSYYNSNVVSIVSAMFDLIENKGFTPDEVMKLIDEIKEGAIEELIEVYTNL